jgi:hypothetical protein
MMLPGRAIVKHRLLTDVKTQVTPFRSLKKQKAGIEPAFAIWWAVQGSNL